MNDVSLWDSFKAAVSAQEDEQMKVYKYVPDMPKWAQDTFTRLVHIAKDARCGKRRRDAAAHGVSGSADGWED